MKVSEILYEGVVASPGNIKHVVTRHLPDFKDKLDRIGGGVEADVYHSKGVSSVIKDMWIRTAVSENATYQYIDMVMSHQDNVFFPKIYNATAYMRSEGAVISKLIIEMEKLVRFNGAKFAHNLPQLLKQFGIDEADLLSDEKRAAQGELSSVGHRVADDDGADTMAELNKYKRERVGVLDNLGNVLYDKFRTAEGRKDLIAIVKNDDLKEALTLINGLIASTNAVVPADGAQAHADLHNDNVMLRLTGTGPQLVITDPVVNIRD